MKNLEKNYSEQNGGGRRFGRERNFQKLQFSGKKADFGASFVLFKRLAQKSWQDVWRVKNTNFGPHL
jgi:hypothetical protein